MNKGCSLRFYMHENQKHRGVLLYEWLLEQAKSSEIHGGSVFRAVAGYGRNRTVQTQHFFELAGELPMLVEFIVNDDEAEQLLRIAHEDGAQLFYARFPAEFGFINQTDDAQ